MADQFFQLSADEKQEVLAIASDRLKRPVHCWEKTCGSSGRFTALGESLVFKGGTSLSKAYGAIRRFSEDLDLTYDIRALASDLVGKTKKRSRKTRSEEKRWSRGTPATSVGAALDPAPDRTPSSRLNQSLSSTS